MLFLVSLRRKVYSYSSHSFVLLDDKKPVRQKVISPVMRGLDQIFEKEQCHSMFLC